MRQVLVLMRQDMTNSLRDNIVVYMIIAPLLLTVAARLFLPSFEAAGLTFAVEAGLDGKIVEAMQDYGTVQVFKDEKGVLARVQKADAVPGVLARPAGVTLVFEGNEPASTVQSYTSILERVTAPVPHSPVEHYVVGSDRLVPYDYVPLILTMLMVLMGAVVSGFNIIHDKETRALQALAVSPLGTRDFMVARGAMAVGIGLVVAVSSSLIAVGSGIDYLQLVLVLLSSVLLTTILALVLGSFADNQITAIAVVKVMIPIYMVLPLSSLLVDEGFQFLYYPLPNYWQLRALQGVFAGGEAWGQAALLTLVTSALLFVALVPVFRRRLKLR